MSPVRQWLPDLLLSLGLAFVFAGVAGDLLGTWAACIAGGVMLVAGAIFLAGNYIGRWGPE